jgi:hypothetical protein
MASLCDFAARKDFPEREDRAWRLQGVGEFAPGFGAGSSCRWGARIVLSSRAPLV